MVHEIMDGWGFEGPDESVGIFGYMVWHEACDKADESDEGATEEVVGLTFTPRLWGVEVTVRTRFTCSSCGEHVDMRETDVSTLNEEED